MMLLTGSGVAKSARKADGHATISRASVREIDHYPTRLALLMPSAQLRKAH